MLAVAKLDILSIESQSGCKGFDSRVSKAPYQSLCAGETVSPASNRLKVEAAADLTQPQQARGLLGILPRLIYGYDYCFG